MLLIAAIVIILDPFYHYHKPLPGMKAVLSDKEYQCIGSLEHFDYDAVIAGSSVCENYDNSWFDGDFDCSSIKAIRSYGITADLIYYLDTAFEHQNLKYVFYNIDPGNLMDMPYVTFEESGCPMYLYDDNPVNDVYYIYNKDVLLDKIPRMLAKSVSSDYSDGQSYNWWTSKTFDTDTCLSNYYRCPTENPQVDVHSYDEALGANLDLIEDVVEAHPETNFYIYMSPYSMLWWDNVYREGDLDFYLYAMETCIRELSAYDNVTFSYLMNEEDIITDLDNYMDALHYNVDINHYVEQCLADGSKKVDETNVIDTMESMRALTDHIERDIIPEYEDRFIYDE